MGSGTIFRVLKVIGIVLSIVIILNITINLYNNARHKKQIEIYENMKYENVFYVVYDEYNKLDLDRLQRGVEFYNIYNNTEITLEDIIEAFISFKSGGDPGILDKFEQYYTSGKYIEIGNYDVTMDDYMSGGLSDIMDKDIKEYFD